MKQSVAEFAANTRQAGRTQFYLYTLFGDYVLPHEGRLWAQDILFLLDLLGVNERAARTALLRMKRQGWFESCRVGRQSQYRFTERGAAALLAEDRVFEEPYVDWDGYWRMSVYSLPEEKRKLRNILRAKLIWLGYGQLAPGAWISPHDRQAELAATLATLGVEEHVDLFVSSAEDAGRIVEKCWDLPAIASDYQDFLDQYQGSYEQFLQDATDAKAVGPAPDACFVKRMEMTFDYHFFPLKDPNLPVELLPLNWLGHQAWRFFMVYRNLLEKGMGDFVDRLLVRA